MSWRCTTCDTYNEDHERRCFVCGQERAVKKYVAKKRVMEKSSIEKSSIEKSSIEKSSIEKRKSRIQDKITELIIGMERPLDILFGLGTTGGFAAIVIILIAKIATGQLGELGQHIVAVWEQFGEHLQHQNRMQKTLEILYIHIIHHFQH